MFEEKIIQDVIDAWLEHPGEPEEAPAGFSPPDRVTVRRAVESAFLASLRSEEGRSISFSLALLDLADAGDVLGERPTQEPPLRLRPPPLLAVESVVKLAPAFDPETAALAVGRVEPHGDVRIWGLLHFTPPSNRFADPLWVPGATSGRPSRLLEIHVRQPGSLVFARANRQVGRLSRGAFARAVPTPLTARSLGRYLLERVERHPSFEKHGARYWELYREALDLLVSEAARRGLGSTILLVPHSRHEEYAEHWVDRYAFATPYGLSDLLAELLEREGEGDVLDLAGRRRIADRITALAHLACIDGALILTDRLDVLSFGATLSAPLWTGGVSLGRDAFVQGALDSFPVSALGTRHQSAINFVGHCAGTLACVISRDGPVRTFLRQGSTKVLCWPDCSVSMFA